MKTLSIFAAICAITGSSIEGTEARQLNVVDYFLRLPANYFEGTPQQWLDFLQQPKCGLIDLANGYISCTGDGAQPDFDVALFRYRDGRPLLAVCRGVLEVADSVYVDFFELKGGKMKKRDRSLLPISDAENEKGKWSFELPRQGRSILVRMEGSRKVLHKLTWTGEKFVEGK